MVVSFFFSCAACQVTRVTGICTVFSVRSCQYCTGTRTSVIDVPENTVQNET